MLAKAQQDNMVLANTGLVHHVAKRYETTGKRHGYDYEDLVSIGTIALIKSVKDFRPELNCRLSTFAVPRIQTEIRNTINTSRSLRTSRLYVDLYARMTTENLLDLPLEQIAERLHEPVRKIATAIKMQSEKVISLYAQIAASKQYGFERIDVIDTVPFCDDDSHVHMHEFLGRLDERECRIVGMRIEGKTQQEIAGELGYRQAHISRLIKKIQQKWEQYQRGEPLAAYH